MNIRSILLLAMLLMASCWAGAEGNVYSGRSLSEPCVACHQTDGNSQNDLYPSIAGQHENYLLTHLKAIQSGDRSVPLMGGQLDNLTTQDLQDLAAYYASQTAALGGSDNNNQSELMLGEAIYRGGIMDKGVAACIACHAPQGNGNVLAGYPRLSGQLPGYTIQALKAYRESMRGDGVANGFIMQQLANGLSDREIEAVANYIYGLH